jgi:hypothetical protein
MDDLKNRISVSVAARLMLTLAERQSARAMPPVLGLVSKVPHD